MDGLISKVPALLTLSVLIRSGQRLGLEMTWCREDGGIRLEEKEGGSVSRLAREPCRLRSPEHYESQRPPLLPNLHCRLQGYEAKAASEPPCRVTWVLQVPSRSENSLPTCQ